VDKEAQEKIKSILEDASLFRSGLSFIADSSLTAIAGDIVAKMEELGYRKLPKNPPLLSVEEVDKELRITECQNKSVSFYMKAQRKSDIKHYEEKGRKSFFPQVVGRGGEANDEPNEEID